jgi:hypothetical protein
MMNWDEFGRKRSWSNLRNYAGIHQQGLRKITKTLRTAGLRAEILTRDLPNMKQECLKHSTTKFGRMLISQRYLNYITENYLTVFVKQKQ